LLCLPVLDLFFGTPMYILVNVFQLLSMLYFMYLLWIGFYLWVFKKERNARFYTLGWFWVLLSGIIFILTINQILPFNFLTANCLFYGFSTEALFFSFALGDKISLIREERKKIAIENMKIIETQKEILEERVKVRTNELENSNQQLQMQSIKLQTLNETKDKLLAIIGHDLRSPSVALSSLLDLMEQKMINPKEFADYSVKLKYGIGNFQFILENLLLWSNNQMDGIITYAQKENLKQIVDQNIRLLQEVANHKQIEMINQIEESIFVFADKNQISVVIRNLISNAIKFSYTHSSIEIKGNMDQKFYKVSVHDSGTGISSEIMGKLFENTLQASTYGTNNEKGTGLGLTLCKDFVEKNGGKIGVESELGKGSRFYFTVPLF